MTHKCKVYYYNMEYFSVVLGFLAVVISVLLPIILTRMTNAVIRAEDERAKQLIREMRESSERMVQRTQEMIREMHHDTLEVLKYLGAKIEEKV